MKPNIKQLASQLKHKDIASPIVSSSSVTRWLFYSSILSHLQQWQFAKVGTKFAKYYASHPKNCPKT